MPAPRRPAALLALLLQALRRAPTALALRVHAENISLLPEEAGRPGLFQGSEEELMEVEQRGMHVPKLPAYRDLWTKRYDMERQLHVAMPESIKLVMGVFTVPYLEDHRDVIRNTWLQQTGVCYWSSEPVKGCSVYVAFVMGNRGTGNAAIVVPPRRIRVAHNETGVLLLNIEENMNLGKTAVWFSTALKKFPWATHIGKMDMDTYPFLHKLVFRMDQNRSCISTEANEYEFIGRMGKWCQAGDKSYCRFKHACEASCAAGQYRSHLDYDSPGRPGHFVAGELYVLSTPLVKAVRWTVQRGNEDLVTSQLVQDAMEEKGTCVALRRLDVSVHQDSSVDSAWVNTI